MVELLEKYLAMTLSMIILVSFAGPILGAGGGLVYDCCRAVLVKVLLDEIDFGISESLRRNQSYESIVRVPSDLSLRGEGCRLIISFSAFKRGFVLFRSYPKRIQLHPPATDGSHLLFIACTDEVILVSFRVL
ncbi:hypothetical protein ISS96_00490 [Candidatus Bathyarchaeota archaeon]|nr:hypothetical protein [Candidatus Bathyarchaeota archaeon]